MDRYDLAIIGGGAAGFAAALKGNELKERTLMIITMRSALEGPASILDASQQNISYPLEHSSIR